MATWTKEFGDAFAHRRVLVTGATGFIAGHLCRALDDLGAQVRGLAKSGDWSALPPSIERIEVDLTDAGETVAAVRDFAPDILFHAAGLVTTRPDPALVLPMIENNFVATAHLLMAARETGCGRFVHLGTSEEGEAGHLEVPSSPYAASKQAASQMVRMFAAHFGLSAVIARPFLAYGPRQPAEKLIPHVIGSLLKGQTPQILTPERRYEFIFVADVVRGLLAAACAADAEGRVLTLGTGRPLTIAQTVETIADLIGGEASTEAFETDPTCQPKRFFRSFAEWSPIWSLQAGLKETINWYRENE